MSGQFLDSRQSEQQLATLLGAQVDRVGQLEKNISVLSDLFRTDTIKPERITPPNTANFVVQSDQGALAESRELPAKARVKRHRVRRAAHQRAALRHRRSGGAHCSAGISCRNARAVGPINKRNTEVWHPDQ